MTNLLLPTDLLLKTENSKGFLRDKIFFYYDYKSLAAYLKKYEKIVFA